MYEKFHTNRVNTAAEKHLNVKGRAFLTFHVFYVILKKDFQTFTHIIWTQTVNTRLQTLHEPSLQKYMRGVVVGFWNF